MTKLKVDLLTKDEITYELWGRNIQTFTPETTVADLRKLLRVHQDIKFDPQYLHRKFTASEELSCIECKIAFLDDYLTDVDAKCISKILRGETKLSHLELRIKSFFCLKIDENIKAKCETFLKQVEVFRSKLVNLSVDESVKETFYRKISESLEEEDLLDEVF